jgi:hypothetical protein
MTNRHFEQIMSFVDKSKVNVEQSFLFDRDGYDLEIVHSIVSNSNSEIDIPDAYFEALSTCYYPVDVHTHPNFNCIPSVLDVAFYLSNPEIQEVYIIGDKHYSYIQFPYNRSYVDPATIENEYLRVMNEVVSDYEKFVTNSKELAVYGIIDGYGSVAEGMTSEVSLRLMEVFGIVDFEINLI